MNKYVFTICSNNYLAQAKTLGNSLLKHNPEYKFIIALCDKKSSKIDYSNFSDFEIIEAENLGIKDFEKMCNQYDIIELNTSIKPFVFSYIYNKYNADIVMYFDPDTCIFNSLKCIEDDLENHEIVLTPHICSPVEFDGLLPDENTFTRYGIYNLGFLATKKGEATFKLLNWWSKRLTVNCYRKPKEGIFVDQLPMNYAPIFFNSVKISKNLGLNAAPWNLHERNLRKENGIFYINETPLILYHFSSFNPNNKNLSKEYSRYDFENKKDFKEIYEIYTKQILENNYNEYKDVKCYYSKQIENKSKTKKQNQSTISKVINYIKKYPLFIFRKDFWT